MEHCSQCGAANSGNAERCHSCGVPLDEIEAAVTLALEPETSRYNEFVAHIDSYGKQELTRQEFGQWVKEIRKLLEHRKEQYISVIREAELETVDLSRVRDMQSLSELQIETTGYFQEREEEVSTAMEGIFQIETAVEQMVEFANDESRPDSDLVEALQLMWNGNQKCNEAIRLNRVFRERLLQGAL